MAADVPGVARVVDDAARDAAKAVGALAQEPVDAGVGVQSPCRAQSGGAGADDEDVDALHDAAPVSPTWCEIALATDRICPASMSV